MPANAHDPMATKSHHGTIENPFLYSVEQKGCVRCLPVFICQSEGARMAKLYFYYSAMNAGKSTTLLQSAHNYQEQGMRALLFTPRLDDRYEVGQITSRIGLKQDALGFDNNDDLYLRIRKDHRQEKLSCILVDEAQFLTPEQVLQLTLVVDKLNIPVLCYGLRTDFRGEPFEGSKYLLAWAEEISEIKTVCKSGKKAIMNARLDESGQQVKEGAQVDIGHHYTAMSRKEFRLEAISPVGYQPPNDE
jgi:thymidine kinase